MKRNRLIFYMMALCEGMVFYGAISTLYRQAAGLSMTQIAAIESIALVISLLLELPWGIIADRIGYRKTIILSSLFYFVSKIVFWQANSFLDFLLERFLLSVALAGLSGCDTGMLYLSCEEKDAQKVFSIWQNMGTIGMLIAASIYSLFLSNQPYRLAALLTVMSYLGLFLASLGLQEVKAPKTAQETTTKKESVPVFLDLLVKVLKDKKLVAFLVGVVLLSETHQVVTVFLSQLQYQRCGIPRKYFGYLLGIITLVRMISLFSTRWTNRLGKRRLTGLVYGIAVLSCITMGITQNPWLTIGAMMLLASSMSLFEPLQLKIQNESIHTKERATLLSIYAVLMESMGAVINLLLGRIAEGQLSQALCLGACFCLVGGLLVQPLVKR